MSISEKQNSSNDTDMDAILNRCLGWEFKNMGERYSELALAKKAKI